VNKSSLQLYAAHSGTDMHE